MNARTFIQAGFIAAVFAASASAMATPMGDGDTQSGRPAQVHSGRSFAEARAASLSTVKRDWLYHHDENYGWLQESTGGPHLDRAAVRAEARRASAIAESGDATPLSF